MVTEMVSVTPQGRVHLPCCPLTPDGSFPGAPPTGRLRRGSLEEGESETDSGRVGFAQERTKPALGSGTV